MFNEACIKEALNDLIINYGYKITKIEYDEKHFGNFIIELFKEGLFKIRFVRDRGQVWCDIGYNSRWLQLTDILFVIGVKYSHDFKERDYCKSTELISKTIYNNFNSIRESLSEEKAKITIQKIEEIKQKRYNLLLRKSEANKKN